MQWDPDKKAWQVRLKIGEEVIKRACRGTSREADEASLRALAIQTAKDEGYELDAASVVVNR